MPKRLDPSVPKSYLQVPNFPAELKALAKAVAARRGMTLKDFTIMLYSKAVCEEAESAGDVRT